MNRRQRRAAARGRPPTRTSLTSSEGLEAARRDLDSAVRLHQGGRLSEAEAFYQRFLERVPDHAEALHLFGALSFQQGHHERAIDHAERAVRLNGGKVDYHHNLAEYLRAAGRLDDAAASCRRALALDRDYVDALYCLAHVRLAQERYAEAADQFERVLARQPNDVEASLALGVALAKQDRHAEAAERFRRVIALDTTSVDAHANLGNALYELKDMEGAEASYRQALALGPDAPPANVGLGRVLRRIGYPDRALAHIQRALAVQPDDVAIQLELGATSLQLQHYAASLASYERAIQLAPADLRARLGRAKALDELDRNDEAIQACHAILADNPDHVPAHLQMGVSHQNLGRFEEAASCYRRALDDEPENTEALERLLTLRDQDTSEEYLDRLEAMLAGADLADMERMRLHFSLAKLSDRRGDYDQAFDHARIANDLQSPSAWKLGETGAGHFERLSDVFTPDFFESRSAFGSDSEMPLFIVGMPRSGTTLVEQIVASHSQVHGAGELLHIRNITAAAPMSIGSSLPYPECLGALTPEGARDLAEGHLAELRALSPEARRVSDKMPGNFSHLGFIALLFPKARIVHCRRDPLDTCLSIYLQHFAYPVDYYSDLHLLGLFHRRYMLLMEHWRRTLPMPILDVDYEELVADQEGVSRRLVEFCGLGWEDGCLAFHEHRRSVRTASNWQVRQPVYASSVGRWRHYERHLGPLIEALGDAVD